MNITKEIFKRATVQGLADYLLYGNNIQSSSFSNSYNLKLEKAFTEYEEQLKTMEIDSIQLLLDMSNNLTSEVAEVYTAIGLKAGLLIAFDLLKTME